MKVAKEFKVSDLQVVKRDHLAQVKYLGVRHGKSGKDWALFEYCGELKKAELRGILKARLSSLAPNSWVYLIYYKTRCCSTMCSDKILVAHGTDEVDILVKQFDLNLI